MQQQQLLVRLMTEKDDNHMGSQNPTKHNRPPPSFPLEDKNNDNSSRILESHSMEGLGSQNPTTAIRRERNNNRERDIIEVSRRSQGVGGLGPEQILHESFVDTFSRLFTLDPKSYFQYTQTMKEKLSKFTEMFNNNDLMKTFLLAYSEGAVTTGRVIKEVGCKDYKTARRYLGILVEILTNFIVEDIKIPEGESFHRKVSDARVYRFSWCNQDPVLDYYRQIKKNIQKRKGKKEEPEQETLDDYVDPRIIIGKEIGQLRNDIEIIDNWLRLPERKKEKEKAYLQEREYALKRITELEEKLKE